MIDAIIGWPQIIVLLVAAQRVAELLWAARNTRRLLARGGQEHGRRHYPVMTAFHAAWLVSLFVLTPADAPLHPVWLAAMVALQGARLWVIASLGPYWTTRIISLPGAPLVARGPYRWLRHPNYLVVAGELAALPLAFDQPWLALGFTLLHLPLIGLRIREEERALAARRQV